MNKLPPFAQVGIKPQGAAPPTSIAAPRPLLEVDLKKISGVVPSVGTPIMTTRDRWRSIDVYVQPPPTMPFWAAGRVKIYARSPGGRNLVASGFFSPMGRPAGQGGGPIRVCSSTAEASLFEIDYNPLGLQTWINDDTVFSYVASDMPSSGVLPTVGVVPIWPNVLTLGTVVTRFQQPPAVVSDPTEEVEIVKVVATNTTAAQLFIQAIDAADVASAVGVAPVWSCGIPANSSVVLGPESVSGYRFGVNGCVVSGSSTADTNTPTAGGEVVYQVWIR